MPHPRGGLMAATPPRISSTTLLPLYLAHSFSHVLLGIYPAVLFVLRQRFHASYTLLGGVFTAATLVYGLGAFPTGLLLNRWHPLTVIRVCLVLAAAAAGVVAAAPSAGVMAIGLVLLGLACSPYHTAANTMISRVSGNDARLTAHHGMFGSLGLALALFGTVFTYAAAVGQSGTGELPSFNWSHFMLVAGQLDPRLIRLAFVFVLVGYGTKAGLAPMHTWLPDAHSEAPSPTSAMLSGVSLKIAVYALIRFHILATRCLGSEYSGTLLLCFGLFSMFLATPFILVQNNLKRMLAYSSLEHVGLICVAIGLNTPMTVFGGLLHMGYHALTKPVLFFAAGNIHQAFHTLKLRVIGPGVAKVLPGTALLMGLAAAAAMGLPPFGLFYTELTVLSGGFAAGRTAVSALALAALVAAFCGMLKQLTRILTGKPRIARTTDFGRWEGLPAMALLLGALLVFSLWIPATLLQLIQQAAGVIGGVP